MWVPLVFWYIKLIEWLAKTREMSLPGSRTARKTFLMFASSPEAPYSFHRRQQVDTLQRSLFLGLTRAKQWYWRSLWLLNWLLNVLKVWFFQDTSLFLPLEKGSICIILWIQISFALTFSGTPDILELLLVLWETRPPCRVIPGPRFLSTWLFPGTIAFVKQNTWNFSLSIYRTH